MLPPSLQQVVLYPIRSGIFANNDINYRNSIYEHFWRNERQHFVEHGYKLQESFYDLLNNKEEFLWFIAPSMNGLTNNGLFREIITMFSSFTSLPCVTFYDAIRINMCTALCKHGRTKARVILWRVFISSWNVQIPRTRAEVHTHFIWFHIKRVISGWMFSPVMMYIKDFIANRY